VTPAQQSCAKFAARCELPAPRRSFPRLDLLIVALEVAMVVTAGTKAARPVARFANPALITAFAWSAGLNGFAFSANQDAVTWKAVAALLGLSIPILIYLGTRGRAHDREPQGSLRWHRGLRRSRSRLWAPALTPSSAASLSQSAPHLAANGRGNHVER
jgi:hypothetical protein